jgi:hypothetical protein
MPSIPKQKGRDKAKSREAVEAAHDLIAEAYPELTQALLDKALGVRFQDEKGNVYTKEPDTTALIRAIEILGGKPVAKIDVTEREGVSEYEEWIKSQVEAGTTMTLGPDTPILVLPPASSDNFDILTDVAKGLGWDA